MNKILVLVGPTASGKTDLSIKIAKKINAEIINADSRQIFRELFVGTAKPIFDSNSKKNEIFIKKIRHYGLDLCSIKEDFSVGMFYSYFNETVKNILKKNKNIILTGGTGLYIDVCMNGISDIPNVPKSIREEVNKMLDEKGLAYVYSELRKVDKITILDENNKRRVARAFEVYLGTHKPLGEWHEINKKQNSHFEFKVYGIRIPREELYERINSRVDFMIENGMIDEAKMLMDMGLSTDAVIKAGIGYKHLINYLKNEISLDEAIDKTKKDTRNYAKRQITWFNRYENIKWIDAEEIDSFIISQY